MAATISLFGSCACERNEYTIYLPSTSAHAAQVFFDNSLASRRAQAAPVTAWLRVPLDWYESTTTAFADDESHSSIKKVFHTPAAGSKQSSARRQFCGYCGTHLTAWDEGRRSAGRAEVVDVTLGSLLEESLRALESLGILPDDEEEEDENEEEAEAQAGAKDTAPASTRAEGFVQGGTINDEDHVPTQEESVGGVDAPSATARTRAVAPPHQMRSRGVPYFEEMVENSRLGRIKRRKGGHTSHDGTTRVEWEIVEIENHADEPMSNTNEQPEPAKKKQKVKP